MGRNSPGRFRREGRQAFMHGVNPEDICPYRQMQYEAAPGVWKPRTDIGIEYKRRNWLEGWYDEEARLEKEAKQTEIDHEHALREWLPLAETCPWRELDTEVCVATGLQCDFSYCAPRHFKNQED